MASALFLSVERGLWPRVCLTRPKQATGPLSAGASPKLGPTTLPPPATIFCILYIHPRYTSFSSIIFFMWSPLVRSTFWWLRWGERRVTTASDIVGPRQDGSVGGNGRGSAAPPWVLQRVGGQEAFKSRQKGGSADQEKARSGTGRQRWQWQLFS